MAKDKAEPKPDKQPDPPPPPVPAGRPDIVAVLNTATAEDLEQLRGRIAAAERELDGLKACERMLDVRLNGRPERAGPGKRKQASPAAGGPSGFPTDDKRKKVLLYLKANGPRPKSRLSGATGISLFGPGALSQVIDCDWFHVSPEGVVSLTSKGEGAVLP